MMSSLSRIARRVFVRGGLILLTLGVICAAALAVLGVPKPPSITEEGLGRIGWSPLVSNIGEIRRGLSSRALGSWVPDGRGLTVWAPRRIVDFRLHTVSSPGAKPHYVSSLPRNMGGFYSDPDRPYVLFTSDNGGGADGG